MASRTLGLALGAPGAPGGLDAFVYDAATDFSAENRGFSIRFPQAGLPSCVASGTAWKFRLMETAFLFFDDAGARPDGKMNIQGVFNELADRDFPARQDRLVAARTIECQNTVTGGVPFRIDLKNHEGMCILTIEGRYRARIKVGGEGSPDPSMYLARNRGNQSRPG